MKLIELYLIFICLWCGVKTRCVKRGDCYVVNGFDKPCPFPYDPPPMFDGLSEEETDEIMGLIEHRCPYLLYHENGDRKEIDEILTCCNPDDFRGMAASMLMADGALGRCTTCVRNFNRQICEMNCSPDQARFVDIYTEFAPDGTEYVNEMDYRVYTDFMTDAFESCNGVIIPQTGIPAVNLMCGSAAVCDADAWFTFVGDTQNNPLAPLHINFLRWPTPEDSMNARAAPCNETAEGDIPCGCIDCAATCPIGTEPIVPEICTVLGMNCIGFSVSLVFFGLTVIIFLFLTRIDFKNKRKNVKPPESKYRVNKVTKFFQIIFTKIGVFSASNPQLVLMLTSWVAFAMFFGVVNLNITSNPTELWSAPDSRSRIDMNYFNSRFGPFYRAAQVFLQIKGLEPFTRDNVTYGPAYRLEAIQELVELQEAIINIGRNDGRTTLEQVCYAPLRLRGSEQRLDQCVIMSVATYFGEDEINNNTYLNRIQNCLNNYLSFNCMATWGGGSDPEITFGGYEGNDILSADTLLINFPISNHLLEENLIPVLEWEQQFLDLLHAYEENGKPDFIDLSFGAERSIEDEIRRISVAEIVPIAISYILMFIYVVIALGNIRNWRTWLIDSKFMVAIGSLLIVVIAIYCAIGVMGYTGITLTLMSINVVPFFILSVGIDNVFLMVNTLHDIQTNLKDFDDYNPNLSFNRRRNFVFAKMMETVGPSIFVSSVTQITCYAIGSLANFPAVRTFSIFASLSLAFLFIFQITTVVSILSLDYKRASENRFDILFCIQKKVSNDSDPLNSDTPYKSVISRLMKPYSDFLFRWWVKMVVALLFMALVCVSVVMIPHIEIGLDQEMALPVDSYVYKYLQSVNNLMVIGVPVFFVVKSGLDYTNPYHQNVICGGQLCNDDSLATQIFLASQHSNITYISRSSNSWIDDFFDWSGLFGACCKYNTTDGGFCSSTDNSPECAYCTIERGEWQNGLRPGSEAFEQFIPFFLQDSPSDICNKGGLASYFANVNYLLDSEGRATVGDSNFMAYHNSLATSQDYITAVKYGYEISANITAAIREHTGLNVEVFPYSVFYVYYEQYLTMWADTFSSIGYSLIGALLLNLFATGFNFLITFAVMFTAVLVLVNMMGIMYIWNIPLNAVSCVNLIVSIGIAVEFCSHIAYAFTTSKRSKDEKVADALIRVGPTIVTGITLTNIPIIVLAFSYTEVIEVFFFRMFFSLVILGFLHGMIFFPVFLSYLSSLTSK